VSGACGMHGRGEKSKVLVGKPEGTLDHSVDQEIGERMESEWILGRLSLGV
jgi:hypothetical protein